MAHLTGQVLRQWRESRGWAVPETALHLISAARAAGVRVPGRESVERSIYRWEAGTRTLGEQYQHLLVKTFGLTTRDQLAAGPSLAVASRSWSGQLALVRALSPGRSLSEVAMADITTAHRDPQKESARAISGEALLRTAEHAAFAVAVPVREVVTGGPVTEQDAEAIEIGTAMFRAWDNARGGGLRRSAVIGQLTDVTALLDGPFASQQAARRCHSAVADLAQLAGWMTWDLQLHATAQQYYLLGLALARDAGDRPQMARMLYCLARQMIDLGRPADALELAAAGSYALRRGSPPKVTALLAIAQARAHACLGAEAQCRAALGTAQDSFTRDGPNPAWCGFFDDTEFAGLTGVALRDLALAIPAQAPRIGREARTWIQRAAGSRPDSFLRSKILDTDGIAVTSLLAGEPDRAASATADAISLTGRLHSPRVLEKIQSTIAMGTWRYRTAAPWGELAGHVRELRGAR